MFRVICIAAWLLVTGSAGAAAPPAWTTTLSAEHPLAGRIWSSDASAFVPVASLVQALSAADLAYLGEKHDNADHHRLQAWLLDQLAVHHGPRLMICGHVHRFIAGQAAEGPYVISPAVAHAVTLDHRPDGPSTFTMEPGGFLLHCYVDRPGGGCFTSEYVPVGPFDGPYEFYPGRKS